MSLSRRKFLRITATAAATAATIPFVPTVPEPVPVFYGKSVVAMVQEAQEEINRATRIESLALLG